MAGSQEVEAQWRLELKDLPILRRLGRGLSGYLYETTWSGKKCARKDFPLGSAERNNLFETEVKKVCKLDDHPNIVKCFGYTVGRSSCSLVQEYVADNLQNSVQRRIDQEVIRKKGTSTGSSRVLDVDEIKRLLSSRGKEKKKGERKVADSGTFEAVPEAVSIISQIATGMRFLHENGVVHGDLKPRNVLLLNSESGEWKVKLADYGLTETKKRIRMVSERSRRAEILTWKAPECLGKNSNHDSLDDDPFTESDTDSDEETVDGFLKSKMAMADVYSFGLTCSYILGGKFISSDMSLTQLRLQRMQGFKPKLPESATLETNIKFMIGSCLEPEPLKRPTFSAICMVNDVLPLLSLPQLKDVMEGRRGGHLSLDDSGSVLHLLREAGLLSSLEDESVDSPAQINTMPTFAKAQPEISRSSTTSCLTRATSSHESLELEDSLQLLKPKSRAPEIVAMANQDRQWHSPLEAGQMNLLESSSTQHNSSLFDVVGITSMPKQGPFKPWREHVQISAPFLRKNDRINQELLRRCIDMMRQSLNFQKTQNSVLSSSPKSGVTQSPFDEPRAGERIANNIMSAERAHKTNLRENFRKTSSLAPIRSEREDTGSVFVDTTAYIKDPKGLEARKGEENMRFDIQNKKHEGPVKLFERENNGLALLNVEIARRNKELERRKKELERRNKELELRNKE